METIKNIKKGILRTIEFDLKAKGHRGYQNFSVYPIKDPKKIIIQSDKRIGYYYPELGKIELSKSRASGSYFAHFVFDNLVIIQLDEETNLNLKNSIIGTSGICSNGMVSVDNSKAIEIQ